MPPAGDESAVPFLDVSQCTKPIGFDFVNPVEIVKGFRRTRQAHRLEYRHPCSHAGLYQAKITTVTLWLESRKRIPKTLAARHLIRFHELAWRPQGFQMASSLLRCHRSAEPFCKVGKHGIYLPLGAI